MKKFIRAEEGPSNSVIYYDEEYELLLDAMKKHEGWREGKEEFIEVKNVLGVHINRKIIFEFLIGNNAESTWVSKKEAVALAEARLLHAIVVHAKGEPYLRPEYHHKSFRKLVC